MMTIRIFRTRIARLALFASIGPLLVACHDDPVGSCGQSLRTTAFNAVVPLSEIGQSNVTTLGPHIFIEEFRMTGFGSPQASFRWSADSGLVPAGVTGSLDTIGASGPLFVLPATQSYSRMDSATASHLIPAFIAGNGRITLRNSAGITGQGSLKRVLGDGKFHMACID